jgi:glycosyltransferase involved in cell wall biosynthesis
MHLIYLTTEFPWPATSGGPVRTLSQLRVIASLPEVNGLTLLSVTERPVSEAERRTLADAVPKLRVLPPIFHPVHLWDFSRYVPRVLLLRTLFGVPYLAAKWDSSALRKTLQRELLDSPMDVVVYIDHLGMARYLPDIKAKRPLCRTVLEQHNVESHFFKQFADMNVGAKRLVAAMEWRAAVCFEKRTLKEVNAVVAISEEDARQFEALSGVHAYVVPVVMTFTRNNRPHPGRPHFCYVGNLCWQPNVEGLNWLCKNVWPKVLARVPDATLEIAGVGLKRDALGKLAVPDIWKTPGVEIVGFLEDLEPLYARSIGMLAPVFGGSGVRVKLLESFRAGVPVVTTCEGAFGLPLTDGREALITSDSDGFADRVEGLVRDGALRNRLRDEGYAYLEKHHSVSVGKDVMRSVLDGLTTIPSRHLCAADRNRRRYSAQLRGRTDGS